MAIIQSFIEMVVMAYAGIFDIKSYMASDVAVSDGTLLLCAAQANRPCRLSQALPLRR